MNLKEYQFLYNMLQELIQEQLIERGGQAIGRWPIYELFNRSGYPIQHICQFFDVVLQHNKELLLRMVNDAKLNLHELKQELDSIELKSSKEALEDLTSEEIDIPTPEESVVNELLNTLFDKIPEPPSKPIPEKVEEEEIIIPPKEESKDMVANTKFQELDAIFDLLQDQLFLHPKFKEMVDGLPEKIMALFSEHGELTVKEVIAHLTLDVSARGVRVAFVVAWQQVENQLINAESLI